MREYIRVSFSESGLMGWTKPEGKKWKAMLPSWCVVGWDKRMRQLKARRQISAP